MPCSAWARMCARTHAHAHAVIITIIITITIIIIIIMDDDDDDDGDDHDDDGDDDDGDDDGDDDNLRCALGAQARSGTQSSSRSFRSAGGCTAARRRDHYLPRRVMDSPLLVEWAR
eukprot:6211419-Pleurochrysis_carterae.AAC.1